MKVQFFGAVRRVTGSNFLLKTKSKKILIDCGLFQGSSAERGKNQEPFAYSPAKIDALLVTHSHIDHIGRIPKLVKEGFFGTIYSTKPVKEFAKIFLEDTLHLLKQEYKEKNWPLIWDEEDLKRTIELWQTLDYHQPFNIGDAKIEFYDAGHILGSAIIKIIEEGKTIIFSGDLGNPPVPLLVPTETVENVDYIVTESTYGDRIHEDVTQRKLKLERTIEDVDAQDGILLIPAFAMERTQELLFEINDLVEHHRIREIPIFVDSPLAIKATEIFKKFEDYFNKKTKYIIASGDDIFDFPGLKITRTTQQSKAINKVSPPKVIIAGSGMSTGGRILHHEKLYLSDPKTTILFIGFQVKGTLGRAIKEKQKTIRILGEEIKVNAQIKEIAAYSAHADQNKLLQWIGNTKQQSKQLKKIFIVHGELDPATALSKRIEKELEIETLIPEEGEEVTL